MFYSEADWIVSVQTQQAAADPTTSHLPLAFFVPFIISRAQNEAREVSCSPEKTQSSMEIFQLKSSVEINGKPQPNIMESFI